MKNTLLKITNKLSPKKKSKLSPGRPFHFHERDAKIKELTEENEKLKEDLFFLRNDYSFLKDKYVLLYSRHYTDYDYDQELHLLMKYLDDEGNKYVVLLYSIPDKGIGQEFLSEPYILKCNCLKDILSVAKEYVINSALLLNNIPILNIYSYGKITGCVKMDSHGDINIIDLDGQPILIF